MGIYDREYVRDGRGGGGVGGMSPRARLSGWSFNTWLIAINVAVFVIQGLFLARAGSPVMVQESLVEIKPDQKLVVPAEYFVGGTTSVASESMQRQVGRYLTKPVLDAETGKRVGTQSFSVQDPLEKWGHFSTRLGFGAIEVWRLVSFQFLHADLWHIGFNMMGLFFFGGLVEQYLGKKRYAAFYLMCGLCGGLLYLLLNLVGYVGIPLPGALAVDPRTPLIGASAGVFGVIIACAFIAPNTVVQLLFPPIPLKMRTMAYGYVALAAANLLFFKGSNQGGDAAHLGGAIAGFYFIRRPHLLREFFDVFGNSSSPKGRPGPKPGKRDKKSSDAEVDRVLDKVQREGLHSLSAKEKKTLQQATDDRRG